MPILRLTISQVVIFLLVISIALTGHAQNPPAREYQIKSVFLYNFSQFVDWPPETYTSSDSPFIIGILGEDPFGNYLDEVVKGEIKNGHPVAVQRFDSVKDIKSCHILFIGKTNEDLQNILKILSGKQILTVSDEGEFMEAGGIVRFIRRDKKIQFQINPELAKAENLKISSKLLGLAHIVDTTKIR